MKRVIYIGHKELKADNVAKTGLAWTRGEVHEVEDDLKAAKLLEHPHVWADADTDYKMLELPAEQEPTTEPRAMIVPEGGNEVSPFWEPVVIVVPAEVFRSLQDKETIAVFMKPEDADAFQAWKAEHAVFDPSTADKRSKVYKEWAAAHPEEAALHLHAA